MLLHMLLHMLLLVLLLLSTRCWLQLRRQRREVFCHEGRWCSTSTMWSRLRPSRLPQLRRIGLRGPDQSLPTISFSVPVRGTSHLRHVLLRSAPSRGKQKFELRHALQIHSDIPLMPRVVDERSRRFSRRSADRDGCHPSMDS